MSKSTMKEMELKKTITQVLISVSIFSLVVSWCSPTLLHNQNLHYYFSCNSFHLISFTMNKNCIFLICNAILVVVANTSPFHLPPPASDLDDMLQKRTAGDGDGLPLQTESEVLLLSDKHVMSDESSLSSEDDDDGEAEEREEILEHCKESGDEVLISIEDADHQNERQDCWLLDTVDDLDHREEEEEEEEEKEEEEEEEEEKKEEEEDGDGDEIEKLSSEELNQKFEDFIRRMKEEFRVNEYEKQQLVLVK